METAQEREVQLLQGRQAWPFHHMMGMGMPATNAGGCFDGYGGGVGGGIGGDCFVVGWEQPPAPAPFGCFGLLAADVHDLFPLFAGMEPPLPVSSSALPVPPPPAAHDAAAGIPGELDDLLLNFWDASCCHDGDVGEQQKATQQQQVDAFNSTCVTHEQTTTTTTCAAAATTNSFFHYDDGDDPLSSIFCTGGPTPPLPLPAEKAVAFQHAPAAEPLPSSSSSNCQHGAQAQAQSQGAAATPWTPPLPRSSTSTPSLKRATREGSSSSDQHAAAAAAAECSQESESSKRRRTEVPAAPARVLCPFALLKPDGLDGGETLADINARILMRPSRPVRHPVGEFACAPRVSADQPGLSGKAVSSFTRLYTPGRGTITIIRTRD